MQIIPPVMHVGVSQPSSGSRFASVKPMLHVNWQLPVPQKLVAFALGGHALPQAPQFAVDMNKFDSRPFIASPSQSPRPG
jgi:hypothetical protein